MPTRNSRLRPTKNTPKAGVTTTLFPYNALHRHLLRMRYKHKYRKDTIDTVLKYNQRLVGWYCINVIKQMTKVGVNYHVTLDENVVANSIYNEWVRGKHASTRRYDNLRHMNSLKLHKMMVERCYIKSA